MRGWRSPGWRSRGLGAAGVLGHLSGFLLTGAFPRSGHPGSSSCLLGEP